MRWVIPLLLLSVLAVTPAAAAPCDSPTNNTTQELCTRIDTLQGQNAQLKSKVDDLQDRVEKLTYKVNNSGEIAISREMKAMGAWHPVENKPAVLVVRIQNPNAETKADKYGVFQFVGPGNGGTSFNGQNAWTKIPLKKIRDKPLAPIRVKLRYAPSGINRTHTYAVDNAASELRDLEKRVNGQDSFIRWTRWNNKQRQQAENVKSKTSLFVFAGLGGTLVVGVAIESKTHWMARLWNRRKKDRNMMGNDDGWL